MDEKHDRLRTARERALYRSARQAAISMGVNVTTYTAHENGQNGFKPDAAAIYGRFFGVSPDWLLKKTDDPTPPYRETVLVPASVEAIPVAGIVEAGRFHAVDQDEGLSFEAVEVNKHPKFQHAKHVAFLVRGDSMDMAGIMNGDFVIGIDYQDAPAARIGDIVVVERSKAAGQFIEWTVKEISEIVPNQRIVLSPRSTNKTHQPIVIRLDDPDNGETVRIISFVVQVVRDLVRRPSL